MDIGKRIALIRRSKNITQESLAEKLNKTPQWLSNIERGIRLIGTDDLAKIASILQVEAGIFFAADFNETWKPTQSNTA